MRVTKKKSESKNKIFFTKRNILIGLIALIVLIGAVIWGLPNDKAATTNNVTPQLVSPAEVYVRKEVAERLAVLEPVDGAVVTDAEVLVAGTAMRESTVTVNGISAEVTDGRYRVSIALVVGENDIQVVAKDKEGKTSTIGLKVRRAAEQVSTPSIYLAGSLTYADAQLRWTTQEADTSRGFHILHSTNPSPKYPDDLLQSRRPNDSSYADYGIIDGKAHYYRVCQIVEGNGCGVYSNEVAILGQLPGRLASINLTGFEGTTVNWNFSEQSPGGFVILWSTEPAPVLGKNGVYSYETSNPIASTGSMQSHSTSGKTYYVRVCENLGAKCGVYSNEATVTIP